MKKNQELIWCKSSNDKIIAGVCSGIAHKLNISKQGLRFVTAISSLFIGLPIIIYLILWIVLKAKKT